MIDPVGQAIAEAEHAENETRYRLQFAREMYLLGEQAGFDRGYRQAGEEMDARWNEQARGVVNGLPFAEVEARRWGPGGRAHFADPSPGDYPGLNPQPETEAEA